MPYTKAFLRDHTRDMFLPAVSSQALVATIVISVMHVIGVTLFRTTPIHPLLISLNVCLIAVSFALHRLPERWIQYTPVAILALAYLTLIGMQVTGMLYHSGSGRAYSIAGSVIPVLLLSPYWRDARWAAASVFVTLPAPAVWCWEDPHLDQSQAYVISMIMAILALTVTSNVRLSRILRSAYESNIRALTAARLDGLTGLFNRQYWLTLAEDQARKASSQAPAAILFMDIDHFKRINDTMGHLTGDQVLRDVADALTRHGPDNAICGRYGGEEFVVFLPNTTGPLATQAAEALRTAINALATIPHTISVSIGIAVRTSPTDVMDWIDAADRLMLTAKSTGRNRIETDNGDARPPGHPSERAMSMQGT